MKNKHLEIVDEAIYAKRNGEKIHKGMYSFKTDDELEDEAYCNLETMGLYDYMINRNTDVISDLRKIKYNIIKLIGKDSYENIINVFASYIGMLEDEIDEQSESYESIRKITEQKELYNSGMIPKQTINTITLHNLVWHQITGEQQYLIEIPDFDSPDFHDFIYYIKYDFTECRNIWIRAIIYLNGKHYEYFQAPRFANWCLWEHEISESEVRDKIIELRGEIYEGFEIYDPDLLVYKSNDNNIVMAKKSGIDSPE